MRLLRWGVKTRSTALYAISQAWSSHIGVQTVLKTVPEVRSHIRQSLGRPVPKFEGNQLEVLAATLAWIEEGCPPAAKKGDGRSLKRKINPAQLSEAIADDKALCEAGFVQSHGRQARIAHRLGVSSEAVSKAIERSP
jgi:hypothetical protein